MGEPGRMNAVNQVAPTNRDLDTDWIREVVATHEQSLVAYVRRLTGDLEQARDVVQEAFCRLLDQGPDERGRIAGRVKPWLLTVCRNQVIDTYRKEKRMDPLTDADLATRARPEPGPEEQAGLADEYRAALAALQALPEKQREVIRLKFQQALSYKEIAELTGHSTSNVGYLIHMGMKSLRQQLA